MLPSRQQVSRASRRGLNHHTSRRDPDAEALLLDVNTASQHAAVVHVAFMALLSYTAIVVFGTTDVDLLIGRIVKLPIISVEVPLIGFYLFAPFLVLTLHVNLLLQLQMLSRKLFRLEEIGSSNVRERVYPFAYSHYVVAQPVRIVRALLGSLVGITVLLLPLATLAALQLRFLAYQDELITWTMRVAMWLDVLAVFSLWPVIMHPTADWRAYIGSVWSLLRRNPTKTVLWFAIWGLLLLAFLATFLNFFFCALSVLIFTTISCVLFFLITHWRRRHAGRSITRRERGVDVQHGMSPFILVIALGAPLPLLFILDGEQWEAGIIKMNRSLSLAITRSLPEKALWENLAEAEELARAQKYVFASEYVYAPLRSLNLREQSLFAKPPSSATIQYLREGDPQNVLQLLPQLDKINLQKRSLRSADLQGSIISGADLRNAQLQGANFQSARLQGANMRGANLQGANLQSVEMQGADVSDAWLVRANFTLARAQGAWFDSASMYAVDASGTDMRAASFDGAELSGANLRHSDLQGATFIGARLWEADFSQANLTAVDLRSASLHGALFGQAKTVLVDLRGITWGDASDESTSFVEEWVTRTDPDPTLTAYYRIRRASAEEFELPQFASCLRGPVWQDIARGKLGVVFLPCRVEWDGRFRVILPRFDEHQVTQSRGCTLHRPVFDSRSTNACADDYRSLRSNQQRRASHRLVCRSAADKHARPSAS